MPTMMEGILGLPTMVGYLTLGASSPDKPALMFPDPLSMTTDNGYDIKLQNYNKRWRSSE